MKDSYNFGKIIAGISLGNVKFLDFETIYPKYFLYDNVENYLHIKFEFKPKVTGVYTIVMFAKDKYEINHPYKIEWNFICPILEYSFSIK